MSNKMTNRNHLFDNIKGFTLILIIIGHTVDPYITSQDSMYRYIMQYMYLFNMPVFAFVTGYFSKNAEKSREGAVKKVLIPYLLIQTAYIVVAELCIILGLAKFNADVFQPSIFLPTSPLYYLLSVFFWKAFQKDIMRLRWPIAFSVVAGVLMSLISDEHLHIGIGVTFTLMLFFVLGVKCTSEHIAKIRRMPKAVGVAIMLLGIIPSVFLPYNFRNVRFTYASVGLEPIPGMLYRLLFYVIAIVMIIGIINLFPEKRNWLSKVGEQSILVYAGSSFAAPTLYLLIARFLPVGGETVGNFIAITVFAIVICGLFSMNWVAAIYNKVLEIIEHILFKKE